MKLNIKALTLLLSAGIVLSLTGCGSSSSSNTTTDSEPGPGEVGYQVLSEDNTTITYVDYRVNEPGATETNRTAPISAAAAEYHTGVDFNRTMFDSADKKCMNCHNELYDTWKSSMHGKSWTDPIFQSKFQDFLRTHLAKIGGTGPGGDYTIGKFEKGVSKTCIKCHAPGAYYANDAYVKVVKLKDSPTTADLDFAKENNQSNMMDVITLADNSTIGGSFDPSKATQVVSVSKANNALYQATFQIGHEANQEGINCAFCHSIETVRMMKSDGADNGQYTLKAALREGPIGVAKYDAGTTLDYNEDATNPHMNGFFRLWGPEKYTDPSATPKTAEFDVQKAADGRYTMHSVDLNGTDGKTHFTGGPYYGPFGVTGISNENNDTDETNRTALVNPAFVNSGDDHQFANHGKALCLACHQRSAGALDPNSDGNPAKTTADNFMELCSTWNAVTAGTDTNHNNTDTSPKCQKCHMERIEGTLLHQWARPDKLITLADNPSLTAHFDPADPENYGDDNPVAAGWLNSHAFLGASKTGHKTSVTAKIQSGFEATLPQPVVENNTLTVTTTLKNLTAHMFPGAHPMRRVFTRVIVTDTNTGAMVPVISADGNSSFGQITNKVQPLDGKTLHSSADAEVVLEDGGRVAPFPGKADDLDGSSVEGQKFDFANKVTVIAPDATVKSQVIVGGAIQGKVSNAAIIVDNNDSTFTRIYGHQTGKMLDTTTGLPGDTFVVRPGFDSNTVVNDNRLAPNETETYHVKYDVNGIDSVTVTYKVYYMQKGANGLFPVASDGWLDGTVNTDKKLLITEVDTHSTPVPVSAP